MIRPVRSDTINRACVMINDERMLKNPLWYLLFRYHKGKKAVSAVRTAAITRNRPDMRYKIVLFFMQILAINYRLYNIITILSICFMRPSS